MFREVKTATFSLIGYDPQTRELGISVQSKFLAAGAIVPHIEAGTGAIATQAMANPHYGPDGLKLLRRSMSPKEVIAELTGKDKEAAHRQLGVVDARGRSATYTGSECLEWAGGIAGENFAAQGNILVNEETVTAMAETFSKTPGPLADRLILSLQAAEKAGGDKRGKQSASLLVYREKGGYGGMDKYIDLRVDDHPDPITKLASMLELFYLYFTERQVRNIPLTGANLKETQNLLKEFGLYGGPIDGNLNEEFKKALTTFYYQENFEERIPNGPVIPEDILNYLKERVS